MLIGMTSLRSAAQEVPAENPAITAALQKRDAAKKALDEAQKAYDAAVNAASTDQPAAPVLVSDSAAQGLAKFLGPDGLNMSIRKSVKDKAQSALPALFQYSHPGKGSDSWSSDIGAMFDFDLYRTQAFGVGANVFGEYHYNDAAGKLKDSVLAGGALDWLFGGDLDAQFFRTSLAYKADNLVAGQGVLADVLYYPYFPNLGIGNFSGRKATGGLFEGRLTPFIGFQWEETDGASAKFVSGDRFSFRAGLGFEGNIAPRYLSNRLVLAANFSYWNHLDASGAQSLYDESQWYVETALTYWFNTPSDPDVVKLGKLSKDDQHFGLTAKYTWGDNPDEGEFDADIFTLGLSVKF